jgi:hypothetical protein
LAFFNCLKLKLRKIRYGKSVIFAKELNIMTSVKLSNPFVTSGYVSADCFCDRGLKPEKNKAS